MEWKDLEVEVDRQNGSCYRAKIKDIQYNGIEVSLIGNSSLDTGLPICVEFNSVKIPPTKPDNVVYKKGDFVEVLSVSEHKEDGWWKARIGAVCDENYYVVFLDREGQDLLENDFIRPFQENSERFVAVRKKVSTDVQEVCDEDGVHKEFEKHSGVLDVLFDDEAAEMVLVCPNSETHKKAELLWDMHYKWLLKKARALKKQRSEYSETFIVCSDLVGLSIGKNGCNIKNVERIAGIKYVNKNKCPDSDDVMFTVVGTNEEVVKEGRSMLEFHKEEFIVPDDLSDEVSKDNQIIDEIKGKVKLNRFAIDKSDKGVKFIIIGNPDNLEQAIDLLDYHMDIIKEKKVNLVDSDKNEYTNTKTRGRRSGRGSQRRGQNWRRPGRRRGQGNRTERGLREENLDTEEVLELDDERGHGRGQNWRIPRRFRGQGYGTGRGSRGYTLDSDQVPDDGEEEVHVIEDESSENYNEKRQSFEGWDHLSDEDSVHDMTDISSNYKKGQAQMGKMSSLHSRGKTGMDTEISDSTSNRYLIKDSQSRGKGRGQNWRRPGRSRGQSYRTGRESWEEKVDTVSVSNCYEERGQRRGLYQGRHRRSRGQGSVGRGSRTCNTDTVSDYEKELMDVEVVKTSGNNYDTGTRPKQPPRHTSTGTRPKQPTMYISTGTRPKQPTTLDVRWSLDDPTQRNRYECNEEDDTMNELNESLSKLESLLKEDSVENKKALLKKNDDEEEDKTVEIEVIRIIVQDYGGICDYGVFGCQYSGRHTFCNGIPEALIRRSKRFHIYSENSQIYYLAPFFRELNVCKHYFNPSKPSKCLNEICDYFHICRNFVRGNCKRTICPFPHDFSLPVNQKIKRRFQLDKFTDQDLIKIINWKFPRLCHDYIYLEEGCASPEYGIKRKEDDYSKPCPYLHYCKEHFFGKCSSGGNCKRNHSFSTPHNQWVLVSCHLANQSDDNLKKMVYVPQRKPKAIEVSSSPADEISHIIIPTVSDVDKERPTQLVSNIAPRHKTQVSRGLEDADITCQPRTVEQNHSPVLTVPEKVVTTSKCSGRFTPVKTNLRTDRVASSKTDNVMEENVAIWTCNTSTVDQKDGGMVKVLENRGSLPENRGSLPIQKPNSLDEASKKSICLALKKENCRNPSCDDLHSDYGVPYLWQAKLGDEWVTFPPEHNYKIEQQFCDLNTSAGIQDLVFGGQVCQVIISFGQHDEHSCILHTTSGRRRSEARRLSTPSFVDNPASKESFLTQWRWYWKDNNDQFLQFDTDLKHYTLEVKYLKKQEVYLYSRENYKQKYRLTFADMSQVNLKHTTVRQILRRPLFVPEQDILLKKFPQMIVSRTIERYGEDPKPDHFTPWDLAHDFELVEINSISTEYRKVLGDFEKTMGKGHKILCLYRVQNRKLWSEYQGKMKSMHADGEKDNSTFTLVDERDLFHGTDSLDTCRGICTNNFDFRKSGKNATAYGEGSYFARDARYSHNYAKASPSGDRFMFRAKVLVGKYTQGKSGLRRPPEIPGQSHRLYDSCVDLPYDPSIFVIFDRAQSYPEYLINYQDNSSTGHNTRLATSAQTRMSHVGPSSGISQAPSSWSAQSLQSNSGVSTRSHVSSHSAGQSSYSVTTSSGSQQNQTANQGLKYTPINSQSTAAKQSSCSVM